MRFFLIGSVLCLACAAAAPAQASSISLDFTSPVAVGSSFDVVVQANDVFDARDPLDTLLGFGFNVTVGNPAVVHYVDETIGPLFIDATNLPFTPMVLGIATNPLGISPGDVTGALTLATLHFTALSSGTTDIGVTWDSNDPNQGLAFLFLPNDPISDSAAVTAQVPEPATLALLGSGLAVAFRSRRRRAQ